MGNPMVAGSDLGSLDFHFSRGARVRNWEGKVLGLVVHTLPGQCLRSVV